MALNTGLQWKTKANVGKVRPHGFLQQTADSGAAVAAPSSPGSMVGITYPPCHTAQVWDFTGCTFFFFFLLSPSTHVTVHLTQRTNSEGGFVGRDFQLGDTMEGIMFGQSVAVSLYTAGV